MIATDAPGPRDGGLGRDDLVAEVGRALAPLPEHAAVLLAVSGGPDSAALAHLTVEARPDLHVTLGHVRHGLRDDRADVAAVTELADALGATLHVAEVSVQPEGEGLEAAARAERYAALRRIAREVRAGWLLVGHTADDQAETLLMRIARGTGVGGLGGMAPVRGDLVRPLLRVRRSDVRRFVAMEGVRAVQDPMNDDRSFRRVRARHDALPVLEGLAPDPVGALARLADLARVDAGYLDDKAAALVEEVARRYGPGRAVPVETLSALHPSIARRVVRQLVRDVRDDPQPVTAAHVAAVLSLAPGAAVDIPDVTVTCGGGWIAVVPQGLEPPDPIRLDPPAVLAWPAAGHTLAAAVRDRDADGQMHLPLPVPWEPPHVDVPDAAVPPGGDPVLGQVILGGLSPEGSLEVRTRRPGDRVATDVGTRKVQDLLVDAGVPRALRDLLPVVTDGERILWIPGVVVDREAAEAGRAEPALHLAVAPAKNK